MSDDIEWQVDRTVVDESGDSTRFEICSDEMQLKLERLSYGPIAVVFSDRTTREPATLTMSDSSEDGSDHALTFVIPLSGHAEGRLANGESFVLNKHWGVLADFSAGTGEFVNTPNERMMSFSGAIEIDTLVAMLREEEYEIDLSLVEEMKSNPGSIARSFEITPEMRQLASNGFHNKQLIGPLRRLYMEGVTVMLMALILGQKYRSPVTGTLQRTQLLAHKNAIQRACDRLLEDLASPPSIAELVEMTGLSARKLNAGFKEHYGHSVFGLLCHKRMHAAKEALLENPEVSLKVLAHNVGYSHPNNFVAAFKREFGLPPRHFCQKQCGWAGVEVTALEMKKAEQMLGLF